MKIAYVYDRIYPWVIGGAEKRVWEIARRLVKRGHEVHLYGMKFWNGNNVIEKEGVYIHGVCKQKEMYVKGRRSIPEAIYFARKLLFPLLKENFDIVDCCAFPYFPSFSAKIYSLLKRTPLIITWLEVWDDYWYEYLGKKGIFGKAVERMTIYLTDKNIAISERTKLSLKEMGLKKIRVIPMGVDIEKIEGIKALNEETDIIFVGRLIKEKNVDILVNAMDHIKKEIPDIKCAIIGDGPEKGKLEKLVYDLRLESNVKFTGFLDHEMAISYMKSSNVFVLPSTREGFGMVLLEANACGLPVITVNHKRNAACDFITDENGFICRLSVDDITEKILVGLDKKRDMEKKCIEISSKYDWDKLCDQTESFYQELFKK